MFLRKPLYGCIKPKNIIDSEKLGVNPYQGYQKNNFVFLSPKTSRRVRVSQCQGLERLKTAVQSYGAESKVVQDGQCGKRGKGVRIWFWGDLYFCVLTQRRFRDLFS